VVVDSIRASNRTSNNGKGQTIKLRNEVDENCNKFKQIGYPRCKQLTNQILVPPKEKCRIM
jgi:hypothetical protein